MTDPDQTGRRHNQIHNEAAAAHAAESISKALRAENKAREKHHAARDNTADKIIAARRLGVTWETIAEDLGMSRQAAMQRVNKRLRRDQDEKKAES